jgi:two-component system sensor histidine kinase KdpD
LIGCAGQREQQTRALYTLAQRLAGAVTVEQSMLEVQQFVRGNQYVGLRVLLPTPEEILKVPGGSRSSLSATEAMFAKTVFSSGDAIALFDESPATLVLPLCGVTRPRGVMLVSGESLVLQTQRALMEAVASLLATALDRLHFVEVAQENRMQMLTERLRGSILAALSHDAHPPP